MFQQQLWDLIEALDEELLGNSEFPDVPGLEREDSESNIIPVSTLGSLEALDESSEGDSVIPAVPGLNDENGESDIIPISTLGSHGSFRRVFAGWLCDSGRTRSESWNSINLTSTWTSKSIRLDPVTRGALPNKQPPKNPREVV